MCLRASEVGEFAQAIRRAQERGGNPDRGLLVAFGHIGRLCTALGLVKSIQDRACEVFKQISESKSIRGRGLAAVCAAVVYIACRCASYRTLLPGVRQWAVPAGLQPLALLV